MCKCRNQVKRTSKKNSDVVILKRKKEKVDFYKQLCYQKFSNKNKKQLLTAFIKI